MSVKFLASELFKNYVRIRILLSIILRPYSYLSIPTLVPEDVDPPGNACLALSRKFRNSGVWKLRKQCRILCSKGEHDF